MLSPPPGAALSHHRPTAIDSLLLPLPVPLPGNASPSCRVAVILRSVASKKARVAIAVLATRLPIPGPAALRPYREVGLPFSGQQSLYGMLASSDPAVNPAGATSPMCGDPVSWRTTSGYPEDPAARRYRHSDGPPHAGADGRPVFGRSGPGEPPPLSRPGSRCGARVEGDPQRLVRASLGGAPGCERRE